MVTGVKSAPHMAVLDFEGTSTTNQARATEIGICLVDRELNIVSHFESLIKPSVEPLKASLGMARLSNRDLVDAPSFKEIWPHVYPFLNSNVIIAHNKSYEITVLENEFSDMGIAIDLNLLCTRELSRRVLGHRISAENLDYLCSYFDIHRDSPHEAISDARDTVQLLKKLVAIKSEILSEIMSIDKINQFEVPRWKPKPAKIRRRIARFELNQEVLASISKRVKKFGFNLVVITGKPDLGVEEFQELLKENGLENRETPVTQKTAFVVRCVEKPGISKINRAQELGIPVIEESQLEEVLLSLQTGRF